MNGDPRAGWISLTGSQEIRFADHGAKASRLSQLAQAGFPTPPGWVLDHRTARRALDDPKLCRALAGSLLRLHPTARWMLRSSSPLEDRPDVSAAGLFLSVSCDAVPEDLVSALQRVVTSGRDETTKTLLALTTDAPVAVLAQPHLFLQGWWTAEVDLDTGFTLVEGWSDAPGSPQWVRGALDDQPALRGLLDRFRAWASGGAWLLELGRSNQEAIVLQARPAPPRPLPSVSVAGDDLERARDDVPRFPLHAKDAESEWVWDGAHSPTPLCPLLAGIFHRWLADQPQWPSRLIHGRWHDRQGPTTLPPARPPADGAQQYQQLLSRLREILGPMVAAAGHLREHPSRWPDFVRSWLLFQSQYYDRRCVEYRRWAQHVARDVAARGLALPPLETVAARRNQSLDDLAGRLEARRLTTSVLQLETWYRGAGDDPLGVELRAFLAEHGHVAASPWDGRARTWSEDRWPLWRELLHRGTSDPPVRHESAPRDESESTVLAAEILTCAEDDDDLLARAYAAWRLAAMNVAASLDVSPRAKDEVFDVLPNDLQAQLRAPDPQAWRRAWRIGRGLAQQWASWSPDAEPGHEIVRTGIAASGGRAIGVVRRLSSALAGEGPDPGDVLVVPTILPADAIVFSRVAAIVAEQGEALGHAAILARDFGVPAVVGLTQARRWLSRTQRVLVDGDAGTVTRLDAEG